MLILQPCSLNDMSVCVFLPANQLQESNRLREVPAAHKKRIMRDRNFILYGSKQAAIVYSLTSDFHSEQWEKKKKKLLQF